MSSRKTGGGWWRREGSPDDGFRYLRADGKPLRSAAALERIRALAIPPAWQQVHIAPTATAKVQAWGMDAAGRKQYRYHERALERGSRRKYRRLLQFARDLPRLREATGAHLAASGVGRDRVLALVVRLMQRSYFRIGNERYAVLNKTFGIATLRKRHLRIEGNDLRFRYVGKKSIDTRKVVADTPLVEVMREVMKLPGTRLFQYRDDEGRVRPVTSTEVNRYLKEILGAHYSSKDIRTWGGTVRAATILADLGPGDNGREANRNVLLTTRLVSSELGNTPAVCRSAYIHPAVFERYLRGETLAPLMRELARDDEGEVVKYYPEEAALMRFLERWG
jgi:DNA topoisomerase-1